MSDDNNYGWDYVEDVGQSTIDVARGEANTEDWLNMAAPLTGGLSMVGARTIEKKKEEAAAGKAKMAADFKANVQTSISSSQEIDDETRSELLSLLGSDVNQAAEMFKTAVDGPNDSKYKRKLSRQRYVERQQNIGQTILTAPTAVNPTPGSANPFSTILG